METEQCKSLALMLMKQFHLDDWTFEFDYEKVRFGCCFYRQRKISMSKLLVILNEENVVKDTILHEIAHALTPYNGHGTQWRNVCNAIGCKPKACYSMHEVRT